MDARVGGGFQAMANYGASLILASSSSQTLGARFGNGKHGRAQALALAPFFSLLNQDGFLCNLSWEGPARPSGAQPMVRDERRSMGVV